MPKPDDAHPYRDFHFQVEVDEIQIGSFREVSGLRIEMETVEYREGGVNEYVHKLPGQFSHSNLVLRKGLTDKTVLWDWLQDVKSGQLDEREVRRNVRITLQSEYKSSDVWGWEFLNAYPVRWEGPALTSDRSAVVVVQTLEFAHGGFTKLSGTP